MSNRQSVEDITAELGKKYGKSLFSTGRVAPKRLIPFTDPFLNEATKGGIRYSSSSQLIGQPSSGKTTLAMDLIGNAQVIEREYYESEKARIKTELDAIPEGKQKKLREELEKELKDLKPRKILMADIEGTYTTRWAQMHRVDVDNLDILRPMPGGTNIMLDYVTKLAATGNYGVILVDSIGYMISEAEDTTETGKGNYGGISKILTKFYRQINPYILNEDIALIMINQTRTDMAGYQAYVAPGGKMNAFAQSLTIYLEPGKLYGERFADATRKTETYWAKEIRVRVDKNKASSSDLMNLTTTIRPEIGIDELKGLIELLLFKGTLMQSGSWFKMFDPKTGEEIANKQGLGGLYEYLQEEPELVKELKAYYYAEAISELGALDE